MFKPVAQRFAAPASLPVTLAAVKARLRIDHDDDDDALDGMIAAAVDHLDGNRGTLGRCLITQTWDERFPAHYFLGSRLELSLQDVQSITSVKYFDSAGAEQTIAGADYELVPGTYCSWVHSFDPWPSVDTRRALPVTVRYVVGYGVAADVPPALVDAIILHVGTLYEHRDALESYQIAVMPLGYDDLIRPHRRFTA